MVITPILPVAGNLPQYGGQLIIIGENRSTIPIATQRLTREEAGAANGAQVAGFPAFITCAKALGAVFNHRNTVFLGNGIDGVEICALAVQRNRDNRFGARRNRCFQFGGVHVVGFWVNVYINWLGTQHSGDLSGGDVAETRYDDYVAMPYPQCHLGNLQGIGSVGYGDAVFGTTEFSEPLFQFGYFRAQDVFTVGQDFLDVGVDFVFDSCLLGG